LVRVTFVLALLLLNLSANSLQKDIISILGKNSYHSNKGLISVLFKEQQKYIGLNGSTDFTKVTKVLKENKLLDLKFDHVGDIELSFATHQKDALLFIKLLKEVLSSAGYSNTLTTKAIRDSSGFLWRVKVKGSQMIDPYLIVSELQKRGAKVSKIRRESKNRYRYNIDISNAHIKAIVPTFEKEVKLKKPLLAYWIDVYGAYSITIVSVAGNSWHPYIVFYDKNLNIISNYTKERKSYNISLKIPRNAKYIKISDLYTLSNIKRGMKITVRKR